MFNCTICFISIMFHLAVCPCLHPSKALELTAFHGTHERDFASCHMFGHVMFQHLVCVTNEVTSGTLHWCCYFLLLSHPSWRDRKEQRIICKSEQPEYYMSLPPYLPMDTATPIPTLRLLTSHNQSTPTLVTLVTH